MATHIILMKALPLAAIGILVAHSGAAQAKAAPCLPYAPDTVRISGTLARHMYYGAPGYGENPKTDQKEIGFYLDLRSSVCTIAGGDDIDVAKRNIKRIQLVLDGQADFDRLRPFLGRRVTLRGTLFGASSGHHHTPVLLDLLSPAHVEP
jgi:hypothetical protein